MLNVLAAMGQALDGDGSVSPKMPTAALESRYTLHLPLLEQLPTHNLPPTFPPPRWARRMFRQAAITPFGARLTVERVRCQNGSHLQRGEVSDQALEEDTFVRLFLK